MAETPKQRSMRARAAAYTSWSRTEDRSTRTAKGRKASMDRFDRQVDPHGTLTPQDRAKRADAARRAYYTELARKSSIERARRKARES